MTFYGIYNSKSKAMVADVYKTKTAAAESVKSYGDDHEVVAITRAKRQSASQPKVVVSDEKLKEKDDVLARINELAKSKKS